MAKPSSSTARVNSGPEEMPNSSSLVWFLSELFPVGRALQSAARSTSMNHLNIDCFFFSPLLTVTLSCSADALIQKKDQMCAAEEGAKIPQMSGLRGASGEEVKGQSHSVQKIHVRSMPVCYKWWSVTEKGGKGKKTGCKERRRKDNGQEKVSILICSDEEWRMSPTIFGSARKLRFDLQDFKTI